MKKEIYIEIAASLIVLLFVYAGASKLTDMPRFINDMEKQPLPSAVKPAMAWFIPAVEIFIAGLLVFSRTRLAGLYAAAILLLIFTMYTILVLSFFFNRIPCSCGGFIRSLSWPEHLFLNLFFLLLAVAAIMYRHRLKKTIAFN